MPNPVWPGSLPTEPFSQSLRERGPGNALRTPMEVGPPKARRRSTARREPVDLTIPMDRTQLATFRSFFKDTLGDGALAFDFTDPLTQTVFAFAFRDDEYELAVEAGGRFIDVTLHLERRP